LQNVPLEEDKLGHPDRALKSFCLKAFKMTRYDFCLRLLMVGGNGFVIPYRLYFNYIEIINAYSSVFMP
jgi:hypothetical protein